MLDQVFAILSYCIHKNEAGICFFVRAEERLIWELI